MDIPKYVCIDVSSDYSDYSKVCYTHHRTMGCTKYQVQCSSLCKQGKRCILCNLYSTVLQQTWIGTHVPMNPPWRMIQNYLLSAGVNIPGFSVSHSCILCINYENSVHYVFNPSTVYYIGVISFKYTVKKVPVY
jgi:hypothetical protein